jgi:hypothetical protein
MSVIRAIQQSYLDKERKGFDKLYYFFDIHGTILKPNYEFGNTPKDFYPNSIEVLQFISKIPDICMIIYTCSHPKEIEEYLSNLDSNGHYDSALAKMNLLMKDSIAKAKLQLEKDRVWATHPKPHTLLV